MKKIQFKDDFSVEKFHALHGCKCKPIGSVGKLDKIIFQITIEGAKPVEGPVTVGRCKTCGLVCAVNYESLDALIDMIEEEIEH